MIYRTHSFAHHGRSFTVEADGWHSEETADAAIVELQTWTLQLDPIGTAALHDALVREREALVYDLAYDRSSTPLPTLREAQRRAVRSGLGTQENDGTRPTVTLEAGQISEV